jgi:hypothetical protein
MPKIKIYIDAEGTEHRVGPNSESRFLEDHDGAKFLREEYVFTGDKEENELYNKEDFSLNNILKSTNKGPEDDEGVTYEYHSNTADEVVVEGKKVSDLEDNLEGWVKKDTDIPLKTTTEPIDEDNVPDDAIDARLAHLQERYDNDEKLTASELMDLDRMTRAEEKDSKTNIKTALDKYLATTKKNIPRPPTKQTTIPQNAMIGDIDDDSYIQGNTSGTTKEMEAYQKLANAHNLEQRNNDKSEWAEYYKKAARQLKNQGKGTSEEEVLVQAMKLAQQDAEAEHIKRSIRARREGQSETFDDGILYSDESKSEDQLMADYFKDIAIGKDEAGNEVYGPKLQESIEETRIAESMLTSNAETLADQKTKIDANQKYWRDQYSDIETSLEKHSGVPATISTLNNLNKQINAFTDKAEGGALPEKEYNEYKNLVDKYNKIYSNNKGNIDSYIKLQKEYQDIDFNYKSAETENGKSKTEELIANYNKGIQNQGTLYKVYQSQINDQNGMLEDNKDMGHYIDVMGRNHNNIAQLGGILTNSLIEIGMTTETITHQLSPRVLIADGLKEYYKGDPDEAPDLVKGFLSISDWMDTPRDQVREAVEGVQDYLTGSLQRRIEWKDLGDGVDDGYEWGEYVLGAAADFVPQLAAMIVAPQSALYVLSASAAGGKYEQLKEENNHGANYSMAEMYFASVLSGVAEYATERVTLGLLNKTGVGLKNMQHLGFKEGIKRLVNPMFIGRGLYGVGSEAGSEMAAKIFGDNLGDKLLGKNVSILDGIDEAGFNGLVMGKIVKTPMIAKAVISPFMQPSDQAIFDKNEAKIVKINKQLENKDLSEEAKVALNNQLIDILAENNNVYSRIVDNTDEMTKEEFEVIKQADISLNKTKTTIAALQADKSLETEDRAALIKQTLDDHYKLNKQKNETLKEINLRNDMKVAEKGLKKLDPNAKLEGIDTRREFQKRYEEITGKKDDVTNRDAFFDPISGDAYVNKTRAKQVGAVSAGSHELLHKIMKNVLNGVDGKLTAKGKTLIDSFLNSIPAKHRAIIQKRIDDNYRYERGPNREIIKEKDPSEYYEEYLNSYSDAIRKKQINPKDGDLLGLGRKIRDFFSETGYENLEFGSGRDVKNFIKDYAADIKSGEVRESILAVAEGDGAQIGDVKFSESAFEDAGVVEDLGLKNNTADIVRKNNKIEEAILREGVKDKDGNIIASPNMQRALAENNLPRAFALARQAANKGNDLTLEEGLKMNDVREFFSEYSLKLMELARTYKAQMKDPKTGKIKNVPFGAYMNSLLPLKYSGILTKLKNKVEASSMSEEATAKVVGKIATPTETLANNEVEGKKVALNTIGEQETQKLLVNITKEDPSLAKLRKYKEVKQEVTKHKKFTKDGIEITEELKEKRKEEKKEPLKELKSKRVPDSKLHEALKAVAEGIFGVDVMRVLQEQDLTAEQRKAAQDIILKFTPQIIAMMPFGTTASGDATGVANTKLGIFYEKLARTKMKATGTGKGLATQQKQNIDPTKFRELVGLVKGGRINNKSVDGTIRAIIVQVATIASNQAVRQVYGPETLPLKDGKASAMFSETYQEPFLQEMGELSRMMQEEQGSWESIAKRFGFDPIDMNTEEGRNEFEDWMFNNLNQYLPLSFFQHSGNWTGSTIGAIEADGTEIRLHARNLVYRNVVELNEAIEAAMHDGRMWQGEAMSEKDKQDIANALFRVKLTDSSLTDSEFKASKQRGFELIWKQFDKMMEDNPNNARGILALLSSSSSQQGHFMRTGSINEFTNLENGKTVEEHQQPATDLAKFLFNRLAEKSLFKNNTFKNAVAGYQQGKLLKVDDNKLNTPTVNYQSNAGEFMYPIFAGIMPIWVRYFNPNVNANNGGINPNAYKLANGNTIAQEYGVDVAPELTTPSVIAKQQDLLFQIFTGLTTQAKAAKAINSLANAKVKQNIKESKTLNNAVKMSQTVSEPKGITVLDFDDTLATSKSKVISTSPDGVVRKLTAEEFAQEGADLLEQGWKHDFSEFNKVVKGKVASLFNKAMKLQGKFGPESMFVLTARPQESAQSIYEFLKANGLNIPLKNITGLANSTAEAKALWIADKVGEGYNDFYFADDALQNVQAVKNMLDQFDVKSKVQQAKVKFSETMNENFNDILEDVTGIESKKRFSDIKARKRGADKGKFRFFIPPSHEDFTGLLYNFIGKGKKGNAHRDFFETALIRPLNRAYRELNAAKQSIANDFKSLNKQFPDVRKKLTKKTPDGDFTNQDAVRVYLWNKHGHKVPGLSPTDQAKLTELVIADPSLQTYAETLNVISKQDAYVKPTEGWSAGDIRTDLDDATGRIGRAEFFTEFNDNSEIIFSQENLNKIEAAYGADVVSALKDILYRTKTGRNRPSGQNELTNRFMNYLNGSVAATMFFNIRSAVLQQMSMVNFVNFGDNNIFAASKAFANQSQYYKDWATIFNSDFMKQRRGGIKTDINGAELAASLRGAKNTPRALLAKLLEFGFKPTQIGDNVAIATGGATFYRNRINTYIKQGMTKTEAEAKAWTDFVVLAEATQQSARPDMVSQQQASPLGKIILAFQNVTSQFNRLGKKAFLDIKNRRISPEYKNASNPQLQSDMSNASRIAYYFAIQNVIFYSLQTALFSALFNDDEEDERMLAKKERVINGTLDSVLRGSGVWGAVISTLKNMAIAYHKEREKDWNGDEASVLVEALNVSPPLGIKARKIVNAERTLNYNKSVIKEMETFDIDNPQWSANTSYIEALTNIPLNRLYNKTLNIRQSLNNQHAAYQRVLMFSGWSQWNIGLGDSKKIEEVKETIKVKKKVIAKEKAKIKKAEKKKQIEEENKAKIEENKKKSKKDGICSAIGKGGERCGNKIVSGKSFCTVHEKTTKRADGKETRCKKTKKDGKRCGMQTSNKSGYCYYHD